jgi:hypothetical protein
MSFSSYALVLHSNEIRKLNAFLRMLRISGKKAIEDMNLSN